MVSNYSHQNFCLKKVWPEKDLADGEGRGPLGPQDVQADGAVRVDVRVVDLGRKCKLENNKLWKKGHFKLKRTMYDKED